MPMPTCQHTMSVTRSGPLTSGPISSPFSTSPPARLRAPAASRLRRVVFVDPPELVVGVRIDRRLVVLAALLGLPALGADHEAVLGPEHLAGGGERLGGPLVHRAQGERTSPVLHP